MIARLRGRGPSGSAGSGRRAALLARLSTIRVRLTLTYSALLFGITALILAGVYVALSQTIEAEPLDALTVKKFYRSSDGEIVYKPGEEFQVADLASVQRAVNFTALETLRNYSIVALVLMFVLSLVIGWWIAGRVVRPVGAITRAAQDITATDLSRRIAATGPQDELRTLADTIDGMLDRLERGFHAERALVEDVSHELRNPVAVVQANVEAVLGDESATPTERREAREVVLASTVRMRRLLEDLLATARTRSEAFTDRDVDLTAVVGDVVREHRVLAELRRLAIRERAHPGPVVIADQEALARAIGNVLSNAVRLAPEHSAITVGVGSRDGWAWVAVRDEGPGIPEAARTRVFDRFYRGDEEGDRPRGSGLGLAIARQIVESHEGRLELVSYGTSGSSFVLWLPDRAVLATGDRRARRPEGDPLA